MNEWMVVWFINQPEVGQTGGPAKPRGHALLEGDRVPSQWKLPNEPHANDGS